MRPPSGKFGALLGVPKVFRESLLRASEGKCLLVLK